MLETLKIRTLEDWIPTKRSDKPLHVAGPCSAETEEQVLETARFLKQHTEASIFRAGIWKPRTRPNSFEGLGEEALPWLQKVQDEVGLPVGIEVANAKHVELALKHNIQILWLGARTTVNPFSVQEIADAIKGVDVPVFVKNPINPDVDLWLGAIERINAAGIDKIVAVHRGFSSFNKQYRYAPQWQIPIKLKTLMPDLPLICDPSHIAGLRENVPQIAQRAFDLDMDGLMVEVHPIPDQALSDAKQQLNFEGYKEMTDSLIFRSQKSENLGFSLKLDELREKIDKIDEEWLASLAIRMDLVKEIGVYKKENNVTILQLERWKEILQSRTALGKSQNLSEQFINSLLNLIHEESIRIQNDVMNE